MARTLVADDRPVGLECTYSRRSQRESLCSALDDRPDVPVRLVEFWISADDAITRFRARSQATDLDERLMRVRAETYPYTPGALRLDSARARPEEAAQRVRTWLATRPAGIDRAAWTAAGNPDD